jgi:hypothetical protein
MSVNKKEMIKEIANLVIQKVNFSKIDFVEQKVRVTDFGNYEIFLGYQTDDLADAQIKSVIYEMAQVVVEYAFSDETQEILEMYDFQGFDKYFYRELVDEIYNDERFSEQIDWCVFDY